MLAAAKLLTPSVMYIQGIGLTKQNNLRSEDTATYNALATSSALYKDKVRVPLRNRVIPTQYTRGIRAKVISGKRAQRRIASDEIDSDVPAADTVRVRAYISNTSTLVLRQHARIEWFKCKLLYCLFSKQTVALRLECSVANIRREATCERSTLIQRPLRNPVVRRETTTSQES